MRREAGRRGGLAGALMAMLALGGQTRPNQAFVPPAWHPDPAGGDVERWWDGRQWTDQTRPKPAPEDPKLVRRRRRVMWALGGVLAIFIGVGGFLAETGDESRRTVERSTPDVAARSACNQLRYILEGVADGDIQSLSFARSGIKQVADLGKGSSDTGIAANARRIETALPTHDPDELGPPTLAMLRACVALGL